MHLGVKFEKFLLRNKFPEALKNRLEKQEWLPWSCWGGQMG